MPDRVMRLANGSALDARTVPRLPNADFQGILCDGLTAGARLSAYLGEPLPGAPGRVLVTAVLALDARRELGVLATVADGALPSLAQECPQVHLFERELAEQHGVVPTGHPSPGPVRRERSTFFAVEGEEVHEVAVGPVHAGIIEPGHFRFQCHGEHVFHLEIALGYQHRGLERRLAGGPDRRTVALVETIAGDTAVGHALASARAQEGLAAVTVPPRAAVLRAVALELERLANHVGDLGALANDVAFLPTASYCGALRADYLNALAELCGNRFGRGLVVPGGVRFDLADDAAARLADRLDGTWTRVSAAAGLFFGSASVQNRTEHVGVVRREDAAALGLVGPAARASGLAVDVRLSHPFFPYDGAPIATVPPAAATGDVAARAAVRLEEAAVSARLVAGWLRALPGGPTAVALPPLGADRLAVSLVEGWRGEICHVAITDEAGKFRRYKVVDPSFHNWSGLALALRGQEISDFPLCNKSFNLSYAGFDL
jgi:Ni,Fe-hydrogenase III large subunit